jgi:hypothetical protein
MTPHNAPSPDPFETPPVAHLKLYLYLVPVVGFFPALWTLYYRRRQTPHSELEASRTAVVLGLLWLGGYVLMGTGAQVSESLDLPLLLGSSFWTSGYFVASVWLMAQVWRRKPVRLLGVSQLGNRLP